MKDLNTAVIDLGQLGENIKVIKNLLGEKVKLLFAVKGNAYGHGIKEIVKLAQKSRVDYLGVSNIYEAYLIRKTGVQLPLLVLMPFLEKDIRDIIDLNLEVIITDLGVAELLNQAALASNKKVVVQLNVDTGMGRTGIQVDEVFDYFKNINKLKFLKLNGIFSHLSSAHLHDINHEEYTKDQISIFKNLLKDLNRRNILPPLRHIASSDALIWYKESTSGFLNMVRSGELIYGNNSEFNKKLRNRIKPVMTIKTKILEIRKITKGKYIGYGRTYRSDRNRKIALLPIGYSHGLDYRLSNKANLLVKGEKAPIIGEIGMNETIIDITKVKNVSPGEEVTILGKKLMANEIVKNVNMYATEILSSFSKITHVYIDN
jgi:alanine racemase